MMKLCRVENALGPHYRAWASAGRHSLLLGIDRRAARAGGLRRTHPLAVRVAFTDPARALDGARYARRKRHAS